MKKQTEFIKLESVVGNENATNTTVSIFNSVKRIRRDRKGRYTYKAIEPYKNGVIVEKLYLDK